MLKLGEILIPNKKTWQDLSPIVTLGNILMMIFPVVIHLLGIHWDFLWLTYIIPVFFASLYFGLNGGLVFTVISALAILGTEIFMEVHFHHPFLWMQTSIVILSIVGSCLGTSVLSAQLGINQKRLITTQQELLQSVKELEVLLQTATALNSSLSLETVLNRATQLIIQAFQVTPGIFLLNRSFNKLELSSSLAFAEEEAIQITYGLGEGLVGQAALATEPIYCADIMQETAVTAVEKQRLKRRSALGIPMLHKESLVGVIVFWAEAERQYAAHEITLLKGLVMQVGLAIANAQLYDRLQYLSVTDELTGLHNHRYFQERLETEILRARRNVSPVSLMILDVDYFKQYNDTFGHPAGDKLLRQVATILKSFVRSSDVVARYGGEEFVLILVDTPAQGCAVVAERIRQAIAAYPFDGCKEQPGGQVTVSIGIASFPQHAANRQDLIKIADQALYKVKHSTRNNILVYCSVLDELKHTLSLADQEYLNQLQSQLAVINAKDRYTLGHAERVVQYTEAIARHLHLSDTEIERLRYGAFLHDVGKLEIDSRLLNKKEALTVEERRILKSHVQRGVRILEPMAALNSIVPMVKYHHERIDGRGYPQGLRGEQIPLAARILAVADSFDAMTVSRPYKAAVSWPKAVKEIKQQAGTQFDPVVVEAFLEALAVQELKAV